MKKISIFLLVALLAPISLCAQTPQQPPRFKRPCLFCPPPPPCSDCPDPWDPWGPVELTVSEAWLLKGNGLASSPALEINPAFRLVRGSRAELFAESPLVIGSSAQISYLNGPAGYRSYFFTPSLRFQFRPFRYVFPFVSGGVGLGMGVPADFRIASQLAAAKTMITFATQVGAGINIMPFRSGVGFRFEMRDFISNVPNVEGGERKMQHTLVPAGSVTLRF